MRTRTQRFISALLAVAMMFVMLPVGTVTAFADDTVVGTGPSHDLIIKDDGLPYNVDDSKNVYDDDGKLKSSSGNGWEYDQFYSNNSYYKNDTNFYLVLKQVSDSSEENLCKFNFSGMPNVKARCIVWNKYAAITGGTFDGEVTGYGKICGGTFNDNVGRQHLNGSVSNSDSAPYIYDGTFNGTVYPWHSIYGGTFSNAVVDYMGGDEYTGVGIYGGTFLKFKGGYIYGGIFAADVQNGLAYDSNATAYAIKTGSVSEKITELNGYTVDTDIVCVVTYPDAQEDITVKLGTPFGVKTINGKTEYDGFSLTTLPKELTLTTASSGTDSNTIHLTENVILNQISQKIRIPSNCSAKDENGNELTPDENGMITAAVRSTITVSLKPEAAVSGEAYQWSVNDSDISKATKSSFEYKVEKEADENTVTQIDLTIFKALLLDQNTGLPVLGGITPDSDGVYHGNAWTYKESEKLLTILAGKDTIYYLNLTNPLDKTSASLNTELACNVTLGDGTWNHRARARLNTSFTVTVTQESYISGSVCTGTIYNQGSISSDSILKPQKLENSGTIGYTVIQIPDGGSVINSGSGKLSNCVITKESASASASFENISTNSTPLQYCLFAGIESGSADAHKITEAANRSFSVALTSASKTFFADSSLGITFVGTPSLQVKLDDTTASISYINGCKISQSNIPGISGKVTQDAAAPYMVTFKPNGNADIGLNNNGFTFADNGKQIAYDGNKHGAVTAADDSTSFEVTYTNTTGETFTDKDGVSEVGDYTVTVIVNGEPLTLGSFSIVAQPKLTVNSPVDVTVKNAADDTAIDLDSTTHTASVAKDTTVIISVKDPADGDAYEWMVDGVKNSETGSSLNLTVTADTTVSVTVRKALKLNANGTLALDGVASTGEEGSKTYTGNGWTYTEADNTLTLTGAGTYDLNKITPTNPDSNDTLTEMLQFNVVLGNGVKAALKSANRVTVKQGAVLEKAYLEVKNSDSLKAEGGSISNCLLVKSADAAGTPSLTFAGSTVNGCVLVDVNCDQQTRRITEDKGNDFTVTLIDTSGLSVSSSKGSISFVGAPALAVTVPSGFTYINRYEVTSTSIPGILKTASLGDDSFAVLPISSSTEDIVLNQEPSVDDFTFADKDKTFPADSTMHGKVTSGQYTDFEVKYNGISADGGVSEVGDYTVTVTVNGKTLTLGGFSIVPALAPATPKTAAYYVEHYKEQTDGSYTLDKTETLFAEIDAAVTAGAKVYPGYVEDTENADRVASGVVVKPTVDPDTKELNILTLKLYYKMVRSPLILDGAEIISVKADGKEIDLDKIKNADGSYNIPEGAIVTIKPANKDALADSGSVFDHWDIDSDLYEEDGKTKVDTKKEQLTFVMPAITDTVTIKLMTRDATIDEGPDLLGVAAITGTAVVGGAILAWQGYQLCTELYLKTALPDWAIIPNNRAELAALLWRDAGQPAPETQTLYSDIDANDADAQNAARWAVENELISLPDADAPDTFQPYSHVSRIAVIKAWNKAQEMKH